MSTVLITETTNPKFQYGCIYPLPEGGNYLFHFAALVPGSHLYNIKYHANDS